MIVEISELKKKYPFLRNIFSKIIPLGSLILLFIVLIAWIIWIFNPHSWAFFVLSFIIIIFYVWWLIRWFEYIILLLTGLIRYKNFQKINLQNVFEWNPSTKLEAYFTDKLKKANLSYNEIYHWVIIPTYQDPIEMIIDSLNSIKNTNYDKKRLIVTLAGEEKDKENFEKIKKEIQNKFQNIFLDLNFTLHKQIEGELPWKWSNVSYAAKTKHKEILKKVWKNSENRIIVSVLDSESILQDKYFDALTLEYLITPDDMKDKTIYQPMLFLTNRLNLNSNFLVNP